MRGDETLTKAIDLIVTKLGKRAIMALGGEVGERLSFETISTGSLHLDRALGIGPESSGKTTLTLHVIAEAQRSGMVCAFIDAEHGLDVGYARAVGVQPDHGEQALEIVDTLSLGICSPR